MMEEQPVGPKSDSKEAYEEAKTKYYAGRQATSIIMVKADTKHVDTVARELSNHENIEEVFLITGDMDIMAKARFTDYDELKKFMTDHVADLPGLKETNTLMVVSKYKEEGRLVE